MPVADVAPHPMVRRLRPQPHILHGRMGLGDDVHRVPVLPKRLHDLLGQVRLPGPRKARQQQALAVQAVAHRVLHPAPGRLRPDRLRLHAWLAVLPLQPRHLLVAIDGRAVPMGHAQQPLHSGPILLGDVLHHQAIGFDAFEVAPRHLRQGLANPRHRHVLGPHDVVMYRPVAAVGEQLRHKDVIPVGSSGRIREGLAPAATLAVHLVVGSLHGVYQFQIPSKQAHEAVDGQLGVVLLALRPVLLHALQDQLQAALVDVRRCVQAPFEVLPLGQPRFQQVGADGLGVPPLADEW